MMRKAELKRTKMMLCAAGAELLVDGLYAEILLVKRAQVPVDCRTVSPFQQHQARDERRFQVLAYCAVGRSVQSAKSRL